MGGFLTWIFNNNFPHACSVIALIILSFGLLYIILIRDIKKTINPEKIIILHPS
jgi:hypothetical protein